MIIIDMHKGKNKAKKNADHGESFPDNSNVTVSEYEALDNSASAIKEDGCWGIKKEELAPEILSELEKTEK